MTSVTDAPYDADGNLPRYIAEMLAFVRARLDEDELWAKAASAGSGPEHGITPGGVHWTWAVGDQWNPVQPDPLEPFMGGHGGEWSQPVVLRTVEQWHLGWGGPDNTLPMKIAESEELRTADGAHIARHDPARVLRGVAAKRQILAMYSTMRDGEPLPLLGFDAGLRRRVLGLVLRALAAEWDTHPDFEEGWRLVV